MLFFPAVVEKLQSLASTTTPEAIAGKMFYTQQLNSLLINTQIYTPYVFLLI